MKIKSPLPTTLPDWLEEIATGYNDAKKTAPIAKRLGRRLKDHDLFQLAPLVCLKFRGIPKRFEKKATEAALSSYVAMESSHPAVFSNPHIAFAFTYLASHYGLDLLTEEEIGMIMDYIVQEQNQLRKSIDGSKR